ncbi:MAG TPA: riboflavin biosynthesis protein RibF [Holophaga sp.]|nr:riboflavin biosynthesis protein RibF [Holophaga sp.]
MELRRPSLDSALQAGQTYGPCVAVLGIFDGFHQGHRQLLQEAASAARMRGLPLAVLTFDPHPTILLAPEHRPKLLMTLDQRLTAFREAGADLAWIIPFSRPFSEIEPRAFLEQLGRAIAPVELHVGTAFRFGHRRSGGLETLQEWGSENGCRIHPCAFRASDGGTLSSTRIREALDTGDVALAADLLGCPFELTGIVVEGERRGRHLGFPTANLAWEQEQLPAMGVYVTHVRSSHIENAWMGLTNVGEKPTFQGRTLTVETHLPEFSGDLYGARLELAFLHRLRGEQRFDGIEALRAQIAKDVQNGQAWWHTRHS